MELFCPRDLGTIESESDLRKHLLCCPCREFMIKIQWLERNGYAIESRFKGFLSKLSKQFEESKALRIKELSVGMEKKMELFADTGSSGDKYTDKILHGMYKWIGPGRIEKRVHVRKSFQEE